MDWIKLIVVAIGIVLWIASNLRDVKNPMNTTVPPPLPPPEHDLASAKLASAQREPEDLKEFLKQIRKRMGEPEPRTMEQLAEPVVVKEVRPAPPPPPKKRRKPQEADKAPNLSKRTAEVTSLSDGPVITFESLRSEMRQVAGISRPTSRAAKDAVAILKSPNGMAAAFVLQEILSDPLSKRPRQR